MGHIHLETTDIALSKGFYVDRLGFDVTMEMAQASFLSVGGYHHHLAVNSWGRRSSRRRATTRRSRCCTTRSGCRTGPSATLPRRLEEAPQDGVLETRDPTGIKVRFTTRP